MNKCIYLGGDSNLTYKNREHVISAGIGGKTKLPQGYVSDKANMIFSKYELMCLRYSPLMIERAKYGPGKRGSLNLNSIDTPDVLSLEPFPNQTEYYVCPLGFLFNNQTYILPQLILVPSEDGNWMSTTLKSTYVSQGNVKLHVFQKQLSTFLESTNKVYRIVDMPYKTKLPFICIGCYNKSWYVTNTTKYMSIDKLLEQYLHASVQLPIPFEFFGNTSGKPLYRYQRAIDLEYLAPIFIHAKNCFNYLAYFKGNDFVQNKIFNQIRQSILNNSSWEDIIISDKELNENISHWVRKNITGHVHAVVIYTDNESIMGFSVLYGKAWGLFKLAIGYIGDNFSYAMICDFEHEKEYWYDLGSILDN